MSEIILNIESCLTIINYGYLYNWFVLVDVRGISSGDGWYVPTTTETNSLVSYLGGNLVAGNKIREIGVTHWSSPNTGATDDYGLSGRGVGYRSGIDGTHKDMGVTGDFTTITEVNSVASYTLHFKNSQAQVGVSSSYVINYAVQKGDGRGLRLVKSATGIPDGTHTIYNGNDGKKYDAIAVNEIYWTVGIAETKYANGDWITGYDGGVYTPISDVDWAALTTEAMCVYDDDESNM